MVSGFTVLSLAAVFVCASAVLAGVMGAHGAKARGQLVAVRTKG